MYGSLGVLRKEKDEIKTYLQLFGLKIVDQGTKVNSALK